MSSTLAPDDPRHGTAYGYNDLRCRCEFCTEVHRDYHAAATIKRHSLLGDPNYPQPTHGLHATYTNWLCRCPACTLANSNKCSEFARRRRKVSS